MHAKLEGPAVAILDTNVVLDWLVFGNPECSALGSALRAGNLRWVATVAMREELAHVLARGHLDAWQPDLTAIWTDWDRHCGQVDEPVPAGPAGKLRCSDPDDQKFIDLAVSRRVDWLLTRDRAVLKLARRLRAHGIAAVPPGLWHPGIGQ